MNRGRSHRPAKPPRRGIRLLAYAGLGVAALGAGYWVLIPRDGAAIPVITADARPIRVRPADPGGLNINQTGNLVFSGGSDDGRARLAAPAEAPDPAALRESEERRSKGQKPASSSGASGADG